MINSRFAKTLQALAAALLFGAGALVNQTMRAPEVQVVTPVIGEAAMAIPIDALPPEPITPRGLLAEATPSPPPKPTWIPAGATFYRYDPVLNCWYWRLGVMVYPYCVPRTPTPAPSVSPTLPPASPTPSIGTPTPISTPTKPPATPSPTPSLPVGGVIPDDANGFKMYTVKGGRCDVWHTYGGEVIPNTWPVKYKPADYRYPLVKLGTRQIVQPPECGWTQAAGVNNWTDGICVFNVDLIKGLTADPLKDGKTVNAILGCQWVIPPRS